MQPLVLGHTVCLSLLYFNNDKPHAIRKATVGIALQQLGMGVRPGTNVVLNKSRCNRVEGSSCTACCNEKVLMHDRRDLWSAGG